MDPIKIIFQFKNKRRKIQHHTYIFIGKVKNNIYKILEKIREKSLIQSFFHLTKDESEELTNYYGEYWYYFFFNKYHTMKSIDTLRENKKFKDDIVKKMSKQWYEKHILKFEKQNSKLFYNYETNFEITSKKNKKMENLGSFEENDDTVSGGSATMIMNKNDLTNFVIDKNNFATKDELKNFFVEEESNPQYQKNFFVEEESVPQPPKVQPSQTEEEIDFDEFEKMYKPEDIKEDSNIEKTKKEIMNTVSTAKKNQYLVNFDTKKDDLYDDENLENVFEKYYVSNYYIYKDDTIKTIKEKICCSIINNEQFGRRRIILPTRQYLWAEYYFQEKINYVALSHKWIKKNSNVTISVKPENLSNYEKLKKENLINIKYDLSSNISKLKRENNADKILDDYNTYYDSNTLFMIDIYNELGRGYLGSSSSKNTATEFNNILNTYCKLYFPSLTEEDMNNIIEYLNSQATEKTNEGKRMKQVYETLYNDLVLVNEIMDDVENIKNNNKQHKNLFKGIYITNSTVNVNLKYQKKLDFFRMFDNFNTDKNYPFIQYQSLSGAMVFKFNIKYISEYIKKKENMDVLIKWFESSPYGLNIKIKIDVKNVSLEKKSSEHISEDKFVGVTIGTNGNLEYRIQWKEDNNASLDDIKKTYNDIRKLIRKLNDETLNEKFFEEPKDQEFKYAFINCIQHFILEDKYTINHNDLSEFARYFYPYVAVVLLPRKRISKQKTSSTSFGKYGTYLRYKRISNYYNREKVEQQIVYFLRYYENNMNMLIDEIGKQFNITKEKAEEEVLSTMAKYPNMKKGRKILKEFKNISRKKQLGIGIEIQGRSAKKYKIRISGCRTEKQLHGIISFLNVLIYLYSEAYLKKKPERRNMIEKLKTLTSIAKRRDKVEYIAMYEEESSSELKKKTKLDSSRIGIQKLKGQDQWSRRCQNSGTQKRQPQQYSNLQDLLKQGYKKNPKTNFYEKSVKVGNNIFTLRAFDFENNTGEEGGKIFYSCDPDKNGEFFNLGFLTKGINPKEQCMPCCFKKDHLTSNNKKKIAIYKACTADTKKKIDGIDTDEIKEEQQTGDIFYILHNTNKLQENRFSLLSPNLNLLFNISKGLSLSVDGNYITSTQGFFVKYGVNQLDNPFLNAVASAFDMTKKELLEKSTSSLKKQKNLRIFNAINNGDIRGRFRTPEKFIEYVLTSNDLHPKDVMNFFSIPGILTENGCNIILFNSINQTEDFNLSCHDAENENSIYDKKKQNIIIVNDKGFYYPIVKIFKKKELKKIEIKKHFHGIDEIKNIGEFYSSNCKINFFLDKKAKITAKSLVNKLEGTSFTPISQIIDSRFKVTKVILNNNAIVPVTPSGSIHNINIETSVTNYISDFKTTINNCASISKELGINIFPKTLMYEGKKINIEDLKANKKKKILIVGVKTELGIIPVQKTEISYESIEKANFKLEKQNVIDKIDFEKKTFVLDERVKMINKKNYEHESYNLFRLEVSEYIYKNGLKKNIQEILNLKEEKLSKKKKLFELFNSYINPSTNKKGRLAVVVKEMPDTSNYKISNFRNTCDVSKDCKKNIHCAIYDKKCVFAFTAIMKELFLRRIVDELLNDKIKMMELLKEDEYFVPTVGDYEEYQLKVGQKIIKSTNISLKNELQNIFKNINIPVLRKRRKEILEDEKYLNDKYPLKNLGNYSIQQIISTDMPLYRAFANSYIWYKQKIYYSYQMNLGYYSEKQTSQANYFKSIVVDWLNEEKNKKYIDKIYSVFNIKKSLKDISTSIINGDILPSNINVLELFALHNIYKINIVVYDGIFDPAVVLINNSVLNTDKRFNLKSNDTEDMQKAIHISIEYDSNKIIENIYSIYL